SLLVDDAAPVTALAQEPGRRRPQAARHWANSSSSRRLVVTGSRTTSIQVKRPHNQPVAAVTLVWRMASYMGCLVRIDILAERPGPEHCGQGGASVLISGRPLGARYGTSADTLEFVRDPDGVFGRPDLSEGF